MLRRGKVSYSKFILKLNVFNQASEVSYFCDMKQITEEIRLLPVVCKTMSAARPIVTWAQTC